MKLQKLFLLFSITLLFRPGFSQEWEKWYGIEGLTARSASVFEHYDAGIIIGGYVSDWEAGVLNPWIIKTDINGDTLWTKLISSTETLSIKNVSECDDGGILLCGIIRINSKSEPFAAKLNACGEKEWCTVFQTYFVLPWAQDIVETPSGDVGVIVNQHDEEDGAYLYKLNSDGNVIWRRPYCSREHYPFSRQPLGESLIFVDDAFLITGNVYWKNPNDDLYPIRPLFTMINSDGDERFVLPFGIDNEIFGDANASIQIESDRFVGVGSYWTETKDALIMEFDSQGNQINYKILNSSEINPSFDFSVLMSAQKIDEKYYFESYTGGEGQGELVTEFSTSDDLFGEDFEVIDLVQHLNSYSPISGISKTNDDKLLSSMTDIAETDNRIYLTKLNTNLEQDSLYTANYEYDYLCDHEIESGIIYFDDYNIIIGTEDVLMPKIDIDHENNIEIQIASNPVDNEVKIVLHNTDNYTDLDLYITSILGKQAYETTLTKGEISLELAIETWQQGMYLVQIYSKDKLIGKSRFMKM